MNRASLRRGLLALVVLAGCETSPSPPPAARVVRYRLAWDAADQSASDGATFATTNDRGYRVRLTRGYLTSYSMELVECPPPRAALAAAGALAWSMVEGTAWAGHASGTPNPAAVRPMQVESLTEPVSHEVGKVELPQQSYCQVHYLIARASGGARDLPADLDMLDTSLHLEGTYAAPGGAAEVPFVLHTAIANGALLDRTAPAAPIRSAIGDGTTRVTVRRHLARAFDGIDFAAAGEKTIAERFLQSLVDHVEVEIEAADATG